ncbi:hypothetical protein LshimejAT787_0101800 [Lyophyllum shimeji]|uniref:Uncharacterized protein n=1 Tax=Lyophyllum shimeji TaxID=47721 RepID=A0A9P3UJG4_LYOSH|nr:hypothetical protein LshimejAT787_0101800 [Lyophyllum shimeji]
MNLTARGGSGNLRKHALHANAQASTDQLRTTCWPEAKRESVADGARGDRDRISTKISCWPTLSGPCGSVVTRKVHAPKEIDKPSLRITRLQRSEALESVQSYIRKQQRRGCNVLNLPAVGSSLIPLQYSAKQPKPQASRTQ